tara:strand:+ start:329 stop:562 length:234 start_codon:yes stop_codon:yes gene_type:complete
MDITSLTSALLVDVEVTPTQVGQLVVTLLTLVAVLLATTEEILESVTTVLSGLYLDTIPTEVGVTVTIMVKDLLLHR